MTIEVRRIGIIVKADGSGLTSAFGDMSSAAQKVNADLENTEEAGKKASAGIKTAGDEAKKTANQLRDMVGPANTLQSLEASNFLNSIKEMSKATQALSNDLREAAAAGNQTGAGIEDTGQAAEQSTSQLDELKEMALKFFAAVVSFEGVKKLIEVADAYAKMGTQLRDAIGDVVDFAAAQERVFEVAQQTSADLETTSALIGRLSKSYAELGKKGEDAFVSAAALAKTINQAFFVAGTGAEQAAGAVRQLTQALSAGALRGDEFVAIAENAPPIFEALSRSLNKTKGQLADMAEAGELTASVLIRALEQQAETIAEAYAKVPLTVSGAMQQLENALTRYIGRADESIGGTKALAGAMEQLAKVIAAAAANVEPIVEGILVIGKTAGAAYLLLNLVPKAVAAITALVVPATGGLSLLAGAFTVTGGAALTLRTALTTLRPAMLLLTAAIAGFELGSYLYDQFQIARDAGSYLVFGLMEGWNNLKFSTQSAFEFIAYVVSQSINAVRNKVAELLDSLVAASQFDLGISIGGQELRFDGLLGAGDKFKALAASMRTASDASKNFDDALADLSSAREKDSAANEEMLAGMLEANGLYNVSTSAAVKLAGATKLAGGAAAASAKDLEKKAAAAQKLENTLRSLEIAEAKYLQGLIAAEAEMLKADDAVRNYTSSAERELELLGLSDDQRKIMQAGLQAEKEFREKLTAAMRNQGSEYENLTKAQINQRAELARLNAETAQAEVLATRLAEANYRRLGTFGGSVQPDGNVQGFNNLPQLLGGAIDAALRRGSAGFATVLDSFLEGFRKAVKEKGAVAAAAEVVEGAASFLADAVTSFKNNPNAPLRALAEVASKIPGVVGDVARAVQAIDAIFGGKLLGTNYATVGSSTQVNLGANGASGQLSVQQERQRAFFGGTARRTQNSALDAEALAAFAEIARQAQVLGATLARQLATDLPAPIASTFKQTFDKDGKLVSSISTVLGETFREGAEAFGKRNLAETILAVVESYSPGVRALSEGIRGNASLLLEFAQGVSAIALAVKDGQGILGANVGTTETTAFVLAQQRAGETLTETFGRLQQATTTLDAAMVLMGRTLDLSRSAFVEFAADIADAAGGTQQAAALWNNYFESFYTDEERALKQLEQAQVRRRAALEDIGLDPSTTGAQYRAQFEEGFATMTAEQVVQWLRAGAAISGVITAEEALIDIREREAEVTRRAAEALAESQRAYGELSQSLQAQAAAIGRTPFQQQIADIEAWKTAQISALTEAAVAAGRQAVGERELGLVHRITAARVKEAIATLERSGIDLVARLRGNTRQLREQQIRDQQQVSGTQAVSQAVDDRYEKELGLLKDLSDFIDDLRFTALSTLTPQQQQTASQDQFRGLLARANAGDLEALAQLRAAGQQYLQSSQQFFGVGEKYDAIFAEVSGAMRALVARGPRNAPGGTGGGGGGSEGSGTTANEFAAEDLAALRAERIQLAQQIVEIAAQYIGLTKDTLDAVLGRLGTTSLEIVTALGINVTNATVGTVEQLRALAQSLGIDLSELSTSLGLDLGKLSDKQSLLNQGLTAAIGTLPAAQRSQLEPLLTAVSTAATEADANKAIADLELAVNDLAPDLKNLLAPFFPNVYPVTVSQLTALQDIRYEARAQTTLLTQIRDRLPAVPGGGLPAAAPISVGGVVAPKSFDEPAQRQAQAQAAANSAMVALIEKQSRMIDSLMKQQSTNQREAERTGTAVRELLERMKRALV